MPNNANTFSWKTAGMGLAVLLAVGVIAGVGSYFGSKAAQTSSAKTLPLELKAATAARADSLSMATGLIDGNVEGLWVLDHLSGSLQCWMLNARTGNVGAIYSANVLTDLGAGKGGESELMMVTGNFFWDGAKLGNATPGQCICYVADAKTGNVVGYGVAVNRQIVKRGQPFAAPLILVCQGKARQVQLERDQ